MSRTILPTHPRSGLTAIGLRKDGRPIWPIMGGSDDHDAAADQGDDKADDSDQDEDGDDGDDKADDAEKDWKAEFEAQQRINRNLERKTKRDLARIKELEAAAKVTPKKDGKDDVDVDKIRAEAIAEAKAEALKERVLDKIEAKARKFVDAEDAAAILLRSHSVDDFIDGDKIDADAIADALDDLAEKKPHLVNDAQGGKRFGGGADGGPRKKEPKRAGSLAEAVGQRYAR